MNWDAWYGLQNHNFWNAHVLRGRITAPLHINVISLAVYLFGGTRAKIELDLFERRQYAFGILYAADMAKALGVKKIAAIEFGVATGGGLLSMCRIASAVQELTGIAVDVVGFDTGKGMPPPVDYRDHCEDFTTGDFVMDVDGLKAKLPAHGRLILGDVADTVPQFLESYDGTIGFIAIDVDYYSSTVPALKILTGSPDQYLPVFAAYLDDVDRATNNPWCGELLAITEFNEQEPMRKIATFTNLREMSVIKDARWIPKTFAVHVLDHEFRQPDFIKKYPRQTR